MDTLHNTHQGDTMEILTIYSATIAGLVAVGFWAVK